MVTETTIRDAMTAVSVPINEDTVQIAKEVVQNNVDKLTEHYRGLITEESALRSLTPTLHDQRSNVTDHIARLQADFTYADILMMVAYPENALRIKHERADKLRARRRLHLFLGADPTPADITNAFTLAQGVIPAAAPVDDDPEATLEHRASLDISDFIKMIPKHLVSVSAKLTGDDSAQSFIHTYEWIHRLHRARVDNLIDSYTEAIMARPDTTDPERTVRRYVEEDCAAASTLTFWEVLQEQRIQLMERDLEQHIDLFLNAPAFLQRHVAEAFRSGPGDGGRVLRDISRVHTAVKNAAPKVEIVSDSSFISLDLVKAQLTAERRKVTEDAINSTLAEKKEAISSARNLEYFPELFLEYCQHSNGQIPTPNDVTRLHAQAHNRSTATVIEEMQDDIAFLEERNEDLWEEYIRQVDWAISESLGHDFFHSCTYEELQAEREMIMSSVPFEDFIP